VASPTRAVSPKIEWSWHRTTAKGEDMSGDPVVRVVRKTEQHNPLLQVCLNVDHV